MSEVEGEPKEGKLQKLKEVFRRAVQTYIEIFCIISSFWFGLANQY